MADSGAAGSSGRGAGAPAARKSKFVPTVPGRRKKTDDGAGAHTSAEASAASAEFANLLQAAGSEATWARGGRGRGRGQQRYEVMFGGAGEAQPALASSSSRSGAPGSGRGGPGGRGGGGPGGGRGGPGGASGPNSGVRAGLKDGEVDALGNFSYGDAEGWPEVPQGKPAHRNVLDFTQYYPTCLPPRQPYVKGQLPGYEMSDGVKPIPVDLATTEDPAERTAEDLNLLDLSDAEHMFLVQLPNVLPGFAAPVAAKGAAGTSAAAARKAAASAAAGGAAAAGAAAEAGCSVRELGSGHLGKMLVFKSGKVKLLLGDVLMDVSMGLTPAHRQDVAAINTNLGHCIMLGDVMQTAVVSPDVWQLLDPRPVPHFRRDLLQRDSGDGPDPPSAAATGRGAAPAAAAAAAGAAEVQEDDDVKMEEEEGEADDDGDGGVRRGGPDLEADARVKPEAL